MINKSFKKRLHVKMAEVFIGNVLNKLPLNLEVIDPFFRLPPELETLFNNL